VKRPAPLATYLAAQGRFKGIDEKTVAILQAAIDANIRRVTAEEAGTCSL
jgi:pyruvate ferredoxin oxidoreductase beta subunit